MRAERKIHASVPSVMNTRDTFQFCASSVQGVFLSCCFYTDDPPTRPYSLQKLCSSCPRTFFCWLPFGVAVSYSPTQAPWRGPRTGAWPSPGRRVGQFIVQGNHDGTLNTGSDRYVDETNNVGSTLNRKLNRGGRGSGGRGVERIQQKPSGPQQRITFLVITGVDTLYSSRERQRERGRERGSILV